MKGVLLVLLALCLANAIHLHQNHDAAADLPAGTVYLQGDSGYLAACTNCGPGAYPVSAGFSSTAEAWTIEVVGSKVAFKGSNGNYLSRCNNCWRQGAAYSDSAFLHISSISNGPWTLWTPVLLANGLYAFQGDNGKFLGRCNNCAKGNTNPNLAFVKDADSSNPWSQFNVIYTNLPKLGSRTLQADNGGFLRFCPTCTGAAYPTAVSVEANNDANAKWVLERVGTKVVFKGSNGQYLSRCNRCWRSTYADSAFARQPANGFAQFTAVKQPNGKWTFQGDNGKYLARCNGCATTTVPNLAFIHSTNPNDAWAQWTLA